MKFKTFSELEKHYISKYNFWVDKLDENLSPLRYQQIEKNVMYYDRKLAKLHQNAKSLEYK